MKYIQKEQEPEKLRSWFNSQFDEDGTCLGCDYRDNLPGDIKRDLKNHLLKEQGFLVSVQIPPLRTLRELILVLIEGSDWYELLDRGYSYGQLLFMKNMPLVEQSGSLNSDWCLLI